MTVHPSFNEDSRCLNCLAYAGDADEGTCRRHAPKPMGTIKTLHIDQDFDEASCDVLDQDEVVRWPTVVSAGWDDDVKSSWCLEWHPRPPSGG